MTSRMCLLVMLGMVACTPRDLALDPVSLAEATEFAHRFAAAALNCDPAKLDALVNEDVIAETIVEQSHAFGASLTTDKLVSNRVGASDVCAATETALAYDVLRVRLVNGEPRAVLRRIVMPSRWGGGDGVAYDELRLGKSRRDHQIRMVDMHFYTTGMSLTDAESELGNAVYEAAPGLDGYRFVSKIADARRLHDAGQSVAALAELETLPSTVRDTRAIAMMRVADASAISDEAKAKVLDDIARLFPGDPTIAMMEIDGAILHGKYDAALRYVDTADRVVGGDPYWDAIRASILIKRNAPGDLDRARDLDDAATRAVPEIAKPWEVRIDVAVARRDWPSAVQAIDRLYSGFYVVLNEDKLRASPGNYGEMLDSAEYASWRAQHP